MTPPRGHAALAPAPSAPPKAEAHPEDDWTTIKIRKAQMVALQRLCDEAPKAWGLEYPRDVVSEALRHLMWEMGFDPETGFTQPRRRIKFLPAFRKAMPTMDDGWRDATRSPRAR